VLATFLEGALTPCLRVCWCVGLQFLPGFAAHRELSETPCSPVWCWADFLQFLGSGWEREHDCGEERHHPGGLVTVERPC